MHSTAARLARMLLGLVVIAFAVQSLLSHRGDVQLAPLQWHFRGTLVLESIAAILASYLALIVAWYGVSHGWRQRIDLGDAAWIWAKTALLRYLPEPRGGALEASKVAEQAGVSDGYSTGAIIFPRLISLATATVCAAALFI